MAAHVATAVKAAQVLFEAATPYPDSIRGFIGLANRLSKFIPDIFKMMAPLSEPRADDESGKSEDKDRS